jgi:hypothetical protein
VVFADGETASLELVRLPGCHAYVDAPLADIVVLSPMHIAVSLTVADITGSAFTLIVNVCVAVHPAEPVAVTLYVVVDEGASAIELAVIFPGFQLYGANEFPDTVNVVESPAHRVESVAVALKLSAETTMVSLPNAQLVLIITVYVPGVVIGFDVNPVEPSLHKI